MKTVDLTKKQPRWWLRIKHGLGTCSSFGRISGRDCEWCAATALKDHAETVYAETVYAELNTKAMLVRDSLLTLVYAMDQAYRVCYSVSTSRALAVGPTSHAH